MSSKIHGGHPSTRELEFRNAMEAVVREEYLKHKDYDIIVKDNTSARSRDPDDGNLFVPQQPHQIRPPDHSGILVQEVDGNLQVSVQKPAESPKYSSPACHVKIPHRLCLACLDMFDYYCTYVEHLRSTDHHIEASPKRMSNSVIHHFNLISLLARADSCFLCKTLLHYLREKELEVLERRKSLENHRVETCWRLRQKVEGRSTLYFVIVNINVNRTHWNSTHFYKLHIQWPSFEDSARHAPMRGHDTGSGVSGYTGAPASKDLAISWMRTCVKNEDSCHDICNDVTGVTRPTRLLRIVEGNTRVRLTCDVQRQQKLDYITLSHCWGAWGAKENPMLKLNNLDSLQLDGLAVQDLPKTFQDAIEICGWVDKQYIWIDSLCIIQDSKEDWIHEAAKMGDTYKHALLNISADHGDDSRAGCFATRDVEDAMLMEFEAPRLKTTFRTIADPHFLFDWMKTSPSFSRAWIHRERQLSPRILHFTATELIWECCGSGRTCFRSEQIPEGAPFDRLFNRDHKLQASGLVKKPLEGKPEVLVQWLEACENLSRKSLTQPTDMPVVLSGIAKEFQMKLPDEEYVGGFWRSTLPHSLLWDRADAGADILDHGTIAPSWSWLSTPSAVSLTHREIRNDSILVLPVATVGDIRLELAHNDTLGPLSAGTIQLSGYLRRIRFFYERKWLKIGVYEPTDSSTFRDLGECWDDYEGDLFDCGLESAEGIPSEGVDCYYLPITITARPRSNTGESSRDIVGLLLQPTSVDGHYRRCGTLGLTDIFALKMRYTVRARYSPTESNWQKVQRNIRKVYDETRPETESSDENEEESEEDDSALEEDEDEPKENENALEQDAAELDEDDDEPEEQDYEPGISCDATCDIAADTDNIYIFDQDLQPGWLKKVSLRTITLV